MDEKARFDAITLLYDRAWAQFNERRRYEIQVSLAFWTTIILGIAGSLTLVSFPDIPLGRFSLCVIAGAIFALHFYWCSGIMESNRKDRLRAIEYQECLHQIVSFHYSPKLKGDLNKGKSQGASLSNWSFAFQVGLTVTLVLTLVLINWNRFSAEALKERQEQKLVAIRHAQLENEMLQSEIQRNTQLPGNQAKTQNTR